MARTRPEPIPVTPDPLTSEQRAHVEYVAAAFAAAMTRKYEKGQAEHGGDLHRKPAVFLLECAIDEAIDQVVYLLTLEEVLFGDREL